MESRINELTAILKQASEAYYNGESILSDKEYDALFDELAELESKSGIILSDSPTQKVGAPVSALKKSRHPEKMLSLAKTKSADELKAFLGDRKGFISWKLDGLTLVVTYKAHKLHSLVTRGNGEEGEDVTHNAKYIAHLPKRLPSNAPADLTVRGEAVISFESFAQVNASLSPEQQYKNPRNLAAGSIRLLDPEQLKNRGVEFIAFGVIDPPEELRGRGDSFFGVLHALDGYGFTPVFGTCLNLSTDPIDRFSLVIKAFSSALAGKPLMNTLSGGTIAPCPYPTDGLVLTFDSLRDSEQAGSTSHHPNYAMAFKWGDDVSETTLRSVEWSVGRTGAITPVAVFDPVDIEGSTVARASVHNLSIFESLSLGEGDTLQVYKANMIIPQVAANLTKSGTFAPPDVCPVCGSPTHVEQSERAKFLVCANASCPARNVRKFTHFVSRAAMDIRGVSDSSVQELVERGFIKQFADFYSLKNHTEIADIPGWGTTSFNNLVYAVENSRSMTLNRVINALGIDGVGKTSSEDLAANFGNLDALINASADTLKSIDGIGEKTAESIVGYFKANRDEVVALTAELSPPPILSAASAEGGQPLKGLSFCVTGAVEKYANRDELHAYIKQLGGKPVSSVSKKTDYLINNDITSGSSKNRAAKECGTKIINEDGFVRLISGLSAQQRTN